MYILFAFMLTICVSAPVHAAEPANVPASSLFFTDDEARKIDALAAKIPPGSLGAGIHLGAVMYYGPDDWALWLQGERWTPATDHPDLHIVAVSPGEVRLRWAAAPGAAPREITLKPYQTYEPVTETITEGPR